MAITRKSDLRKHIGKAYQKTYQKAYHLYSSQKSDEALTIFIGLNQPNDIDVQAAIARCYLRLNQPLKAIDTLTEFSNNVRLGISDIRIINIVLATAYERLKDYDKAKELLTNIPQEEQDKFDVKFAWIGFYCKQRKYADAMRLLKTMQNQYLSMNAHNQRIYNNFLRSINIGLGIVDPIDTLLDDLKDKTQRFESKKMDDRLYSAFIDGVIDHLDKYNYDQRIIQFIVDKLKYFLSEDSHFNSRILYLNLVYLYEKTNKINDAFDVVKRALERFPYFWAAQHFYARMSMQYENDIEKAISLFEIIYKQENLEPSFMPTNQQKARAYFGSAICYYNDAKIDESISFARKAIAADASYAPAYSQLAKCYASLAGMKQGDPSQINLYRSLAEDNFERARQLDPVRFERLHGKRREIAEESSSVSTATTSTSATATTFVANFDDLAAWPPLGAAQKTQPVVPASEEPPVAPTNLSTTSLLSENKVEATVAAEQVTRKERRKTYRQTNPNIEPPKTAKKVAKAKKPKKEKEVLPNNPVTPPGFFSSAYSFFANSATYFSRVVSSAIEPILSEFELYPFRQDGENISRGDESPKAYKRG